MKTDPYPWATQMVKHPKSHRVHHLLSFVSGFPSFPLNVFFCTAIHLNPSSFGVCLSPESGVVDVWAANAHEMLVKSRFIHF